MALKIPDEIHTLTNHLSYTVRQNINWAVALLDDAM
jgi:DNA-directed RNA polymerase subunit L